MIIFGALIGLLILFSCLWYFHGPEWDFGIIVTSGFILFLLLVMVTNHSVVKGKLKGFEQIRITINESRKTMTEIERAAIVLKMAEENSWLKTLQYWNSTIFDIYIPDEVDKTPFLALKNER